MFSRNISVHASLFIKITTRAKARGLCYTCIKLELILLISAEKCTKNLLVGKVWHDCRLVLDEFRGILSTPQNYGGGLMNLLNTIMIE